MNKENIARIHYLSGKLLRMMFFSVITVPGIVCMIVFLFLPKDIPGSTIYDMATLIIHQDGKMKVCIHGLGDTVAPHSNLCDPMMNKEQWVSSLNAVIGGVYTLSMCVGFILSILFFLWRFNKRSDL